MIDDRIERPAIRARLIGVCAHGAELAGLPVTPVRLLAVIALLFAFKLTVVAYCIAAIIFRSGPR